LLLFLAYVINYIDRQIVTILQEPIKADLNLSDTQLGLMTGLSFALFYATLGVPIARIADRKSRSRLIAWAITVWSAMTAACAAVSGFWSLLACRMGVGIGEAGLSPPAHSLISDYYEPAKRATAMAIYSIGIQVGVFVGFLAGGAINHFFGWRMAFLVVGVPGLLLAVLIRFTMREPERGRFDVPAMPAKGAEPGSFATLAALWRIRPFRFAALASGFHALVL
jgi:MFS family permease